jgi:hypothetical protein
LAPERYRVQFTIGQETHEKLRRLQALLRREIPDGDPGAIFDRALTVLLEKVEKTKLAAAAKPRPKRPIRPETDPNRPIRPGTDKDLRKPGLPSRHVPGEPYAKQGPATVANISLRCWRHNQYEAELIFGPHGPSIVREACQSFGLTRSRPSRTIDS